MSGSGYDYSVGTFSPDGRIFQVEYAQKAVENASTAVAIKCVDGVVIAIGKQQASRLLVAGSNRRVFSIDRHTGFVVTGYSADGRQMLSRARNEAVEYRKLYGMFIPPGTLSHRLAMQVHLYTMYGSVRPYGAAGIIAGYDADSKSPQLYLVEPSGNSARYFGCATGKGANAAKTELEKLLNKHGANGITCAEAVKELARILHAIRDPSKDRELELEMGWVTEATEWKHVHVPTDILAAADTAAREALGEEGTTAMEL